MLAFGHARAYPKHAFAGLTTGRPRLPTPPRSSHPVNSLSRARTCGGGTTMPPDVQPPRSMRQATLVFRCPLSYSEDSFRSPCLSWHARYPSAPSILLPPPRSRTPLPDFAPHPQPPFLMRTVFRACCAGVKAVRLGYRSLIPRMRVGTRVGTKRRGNPSVSRLPSAHGLLGCHGESLIAV
ncbi:hypothetical protein NUW54_g5362 [Trametes sanguinea]|uniref:Uncharacterized protein n=1 Tax=Trametes sanguinea TaxID=158606 RepID=A0ACC1PVC9_9APHY|nr:hypothetical protein NUW54_g5362 [Trametes sanguinea]